MSFTTYTGSTAIVAALGTTPEERALTTDQFKAKFDEGLTNFITWLNATHIVELNARAVIQDDEQIIRIMEG